MKTQKNKDYKFHEYSNLFPMASESELSELKEDIRENGLIEPIILYQNKILDGRNRMIACMSEGVTPAFTEYKGNDPLQFVLSKNINRRHLTESQRAAIAAEIATLPQGRKTKSEMGGCTEDNTKNEYENEGKNQAEGKPANLPVSTAPVSTAPVKAVPVKTVPVKTVQKTPTLAEASETFKVSPRLIQDAKKIKDESPETFKEVKQGEKTVHAAIQEMKAAKDENSEADTEKQIKQIRKDIFSLSEKLEQKFTEYHEFAEDHGISKNEMGEFFRLYHEMKLLIFGKYTNKK
jgi:hypothetical protein